MLGLGVLGLGFGAYYFFIFIPNKRQINDLMNVAFNPVGYYIFLGLILFVSLILVKVGWTRLRSPAIFSPMVDG